MVGRAEDFDCALLTVVADNDAHAGLLVRGQGIANASNGLYQFIPADLFAQVAVVPLTVQMLVVSEAKETVRLELAFAESISDVPTVCAPGLEKVIL